MIYAKELRKISSYRDGLLYRNDTGSCMGGIGVDGYWKIKIKGKSYLAHRLIWLHAFGEWPKEEIDHIDGNPSNNRLENLRIASHKQNCGNRRKNKNNTSGYSGVKYRKDCERFQAVIKMDGITRHLGYYDTPQEAAAAWIQFSIDYRGEFHRSI